MIGNILWSREEVKQRKNGGVVPAVKVNSGYYFYETLLILVVGEVVVAGTVIWLGL